MINGYCRPSSPADIQPVSEHCLIYEIVIQIILYKNSLLDYRRLLIRHLILPIWLTKDGSIITLYAILNWPWLRPNLTYQTMTRMYVREAIHAVSHAMRFERKKIKCTKMTL